MIGDVMRRVLASLTTLSAALALTACGTSGDLPSGESANVKRGAELFSQRCQGCHTMDVVKAEGGASDVRDRERVDGPNFNVRKEERNDVLYAIRNGGYSGAIMPENIVVGQDASDVADFLSKYSGADAKSPSGPNG